MSSKKTAPRRFVRAIAIANPRSRTPEDGKQSVLMTADEQERSARSYRGRPIRIRHYDDSKDMDVGTMGESWVHDDKLYTMFDIDRDWKKPWAWQAGTYVLNDWFDGVSAHTIGLRNENTGEVYANVAARHRSSGAVAFVRWKRHVAAKAVASLQNGKMEEYDDGTIRVLDNIYENNYYNKEAIPEYIAAAAASVINKASNL